MRLGLPDLAVLHAKETHRHAQRGRVLGIGEREHVRATRPGADDRLALGERPEAGEGVPQHRRALELLALGRASHLRLDQRTHQGDLAPEHLRRSVDLRPVRLRTDRPDAGGAADLEVVVEARLLREPHAPAQLEEVAEELLDASSLAGARVRPEEEQARPTPGPADEDDPRDLLADRDREVRVAPVVLQENVVRRLVLLDEVRFEEERLALRRRGSELDARALRDDRPVLLDARPQVVEDPTPQAAGLPHVDDLPAGRPEEIDPRNIRAPPEPLAGLRGELARGNERRKLGPTALGHRRARRKVGTGGGRCGRR